MQCYLFDLIFYLQDGLFIERRMCDYSAQNIVKNNLFTHLDVCECTEQLQLQG
jgi:hypothetical protein